MNSSGLKIFTATSFMTVLLVTLCVSCFSSFIFASENFDRKQWDKDNRHVRRLLSVSLNIRENLRAFSASHVDTDVISGSDNYYVEDILVDYARVRNILLIIENRWKLVAQEDKNSKPDDITIEATERLLANTISLAAATVSLENGRALLDSLDSTVYEERANRPLNYRGEVYVEDLFADVEFQVNSSTRKNDISSRLKLFGENSEILEQVIAKNGDSASLLLGIIDSSGKLDTIENEKQLVTIGRSAGARVKRFRYSLGKAFKASFEFIISVFSRPTVKIKIRKPHIRDEKMEKVTEELTELCRPCDIFLHKTGYQANDWMIPGYFSHSGMWLGSSSDQDALGLYDRKTNKYSYDTARKNEKHLRGHPVFEGLFGGILSTNLNTYMLPCDTIVVLRFKEGYAHDKGAIACKAVFHLGQTYDFGFDVNNIDKIVCSELIYQAFPETIKWPVTKALGRYTFSPDEIGSMARAGHDEFPFEVVYLHDGERSYKGAEAIEAFTRIVEPKLKFGKPVK